MDCTHFSDVKQFLYLASSGRSVIMYSTELANSLLSKAVEWTIKTHQLEWLEMLELKELEHGKLG